MLWGCTVYCMLFSLTISVIIWKNNLSILLKISLCLVDTLYLMAYAIVTWIQSRVYNRGTKCNIALIFVFFFGDEQMVFCYMYISLSAKCFFFFFLLQGSSFLSRLKALSPCRLSVHGQISLLQVIDLGLTQFECVVVFHCT